MRESREPHDGHEPDDAWAERLRDRVDDVVPVIPVDVDAAVRGGRRRRAARRAAGATGVAAAVVGALLVVPGVAGVLDRDDWPAVLGGPDEGEGAEDPEPGVARILEDGPECFAKDVLMQVGMYPGNPDLEHPLVEKYGVRPDVGTGSIPEGFEPVAVVECRFGGWEEIRSAVDPAPYEEVTYGPSPERRAVSGSADLDAYVEAFRQPSESWEEMEERIRDAAEPGEDVAVGCPAVLYMYPAVFLVDARGRAVFPTIPSTGCGFPLVGAPQDHRLVPLDVVRYEAVPETWAREALESVSADVMTMLDEEGIDWSFVRPTEDLGGLEVSGPRTATDDAVQARVRDLVATRIGPVPVSFVPDEPELAQAFRPHDPVARIRGHLMRVEPEFVEQGREERVEVHFPEGTARGVAYVLEKSWDGWRTADRENTRWLAQHYLISGAAGGEPRSWPVGDDGIGWDDVGVGGPGPDTLVLPPLEVEGLPASQWRLCTANAVENVCAWLVVENRTGW